MTRFASFAPGVVRRQDAIVRCTVAGWLRDHQIYAERTGRWAPLRDEDRQVAVEKLGRRRVEQMELAAADRLSAVEFKRLAVWTSGTVLPTRAELGVCALRLFGRLGVDEERLIR